MRGISIVFALLLPLVSLFVMWTTLHSAEHGVEIPVLKGEAVFGKLTYDKHCSSCHGTNGIGTDKGPPFLHRVYHPNHHGDGSFYRAVEHGSPAHHWKFGDMPPVEGITKEQVRFIIEYVRTLQKVNGIF